MSRALHWQPVYRICVYVPPNGLQALQQGILAVHALRSGDYDRVMWTTAHCREQFRPLAGANPTVGTPGETTVVDSVRLEFALPRDPALLDRVIAEGILPHHPWDCPAIFVDEARFPQSGATA